ncbi:hypothetical protein NM208_g4784 [Fusarium decemcellulare]|uniref:Uncharacterized protein n=1 Tax=Fusarium decemcellulare TaxID=57161 RepID=A0ACC1SJJ3_9HYPO|nr:hypothetical protein NM208_g4784 [Fusarium decemcellulare]
MDRFGTGNHQKNSTFFKLCPDVRRLIYIELFGYKWVHVAFGTKEDKFKRRGHPRVATGWWHCICRRTHQTGPHFHSENDHKWCYLATNILLTCKRAFEEGIPILYHSNTLQFERPWDFLFFKTLTLDYGRLLDSLVINITIDSYFSRESPTETMGSLRPLAEAISNTGVSSLWVRFRVSLSSFNKDIPKSKRKRTLAREIAHALDILTVANIDTVVFLSNEMKSETEKYTTNFSVENLIEISDWSGASILDAEDSDNERHEYNSFQALLRAFPRD